MKYASEMETTFWVCERVEQIEENKCYRSERKRKSHSQMIYKVLTRVSFQHETHGIAIKTGALKNDVITVTKNTIVI